MTPASPAEIERFAKELWAHRADRPDDRAATVVAMLTETGLALVKLEESDG